MTGYRKALQLAPVSLLVLGLSWIGTGRISADSARPIGKRSYSSPNGSLRLEVDPRRLPDGSYHGSLLTLTSSTGDTLWTRTDADFEDFHFPTHACISDDGRFAVLGGYSAHNLSWDRDYREGLRFYNPEGRLIRFVSRHDLPLGPYSISTAHWYDADKTRIAGDRLVFHTPGIEEPMEFELSTGKLSQGQIIPGQGDDHHWRDWLMNQFETSNAYSGLRATAGEPICWQPNEDGSCGLMVVSWFALLANPARFDGQRVQLVGFTEFGFESNRIFFSREHAEHGASADALWLDIEGLSTDSAKQCHHRYCLIEAVFDAQNRGHLGCCAGTLREITRLELREGRE